MLRRTGRILGLMFILTFFATPLSFADGLTLTETYPYDGDTGLQVENTGFKLYFDQSMQGTEEINKDAFSVKDSSGKDYPLRIIYGIKEDEKNYILALIESTLESTTEYTLTISGDTTSASGDTLGEDITISATTINTSTSMTISMVMMGVMMVGMIFLSTRSMKKQMEEEKKNSAKDDKVNPYKISKETGKSVEDVVAKDQKDKEKQRQKQERKQLKERSDDDTPEIEVSNNKKVKGPRPISAGGSSYITGRKAAAEEAAKQKAASGTTNPKNKKKAKKK